MELNFADEIIITAIIENTVNKSGFYAEHGLSILLIAKTESTSSLEW